MVTLVQEPHSGEAASGGWQGIRQQLFGQKRERDAEDGLLLVITHLQTKLALATGAIEGPLKSSTVRAQALRVVQDGLNALLAWHAEQLTAARAVGSWSAPLPKLADDVLGAIKAVHPLFEGAESDGGAIHAQDVAESVAQLRGEESGAFFNDALDGFVGMLEAVYIRASLDAPTASTTASMQETWDVLLDELRALRWPEKVAELEAAGEAAEEAEAMQVMDVVVHRSERSKELASLMDRGPPAPTMLHLIPRSARDDVEAARDDDGGARDDVGTGRGDDGARVIFPARFRRLELV